MSGSDFRLSKKWIRQHEALSDASINALCKDIYDTKAKFGVWIHVALELPVTKTLKDDTGKRHSYAWNNALTTDAMRHSVSLTVGPSQWSEYVPQQPKDILDEPADDKDRDVEWVVAWLDIPPFQVDPDTKEHTPVLPLVPGTQLVITPHRLSVEYLDNQDKTMLLQDVLGEDAAPRADLSQYRDSTTPPFFEVPCHRIIGDALSDEFMRKTSSLLRRENEGAWALSEYVPGAPINDYPLVKTMGKERGPAPKAREGLYDHVHVVSPKDVDQAHHVGMLFTQMKTMPSLAAVLVNKRAPAFYPDIVYVEQSRVMDSTTEQKLLDVEFRVVRRIGIVIEKSMWRVLYGIH